MKISKKGQSAGIIASLLTVVIAFVALVIVTTLMSGVLSGIRTSQCNGQNCDVTTNLSTLQSNITVQGLEGLESLSNQYANIGTIVAVGAIIGILVGAFAFFRSR